MKIWNILKRLKDSWFFELLLTILMVLGAVLLLFVMALLGVILYVWARINHKSLDRAMLTHNRTMEDKEDVEGETHHPPPP